MRRFRLKRLFLMLGCVCLLLTLSVTRVLRAQSDRQVVLNSIESLEADDGVSVNLYFTVIDKSGAIVTPQTVSVLVDGKPVKVNALGKPTQPLSVTLLLDGSSDVSIVQADLRKAVQQLFTSASADTQFSVLKYGQKTDLLSPTTADRTALAASLNSYYPNGPVACLSTAFSQALSTASTSPAARRAILVFTGGKDQGADRQACSPGGWVTTIATTEKSLAPRIPIYVIAWPGTDTLDATTLQTLTQQTGGYLLVGNKQSDSVGSLFQRMFNIVQNQSVVSALAQSAAGTHSVQVEAVFPDGSKIQSNSLDFIVQHDHQPTATPIPSVTPIAVQVTVQPIRVSSDFSSLSFDVQLSGAENVAEYHAIFKSGNQLLATYVLPAPLKGTVTLPTDKLGSGTISLDLVAYGKDGQPLAGVYDQTFQIARPTLTAPPPTSTPLVAGVDIESFQFDPKANLYHLTLVVTASDQLNNLELDIFAADNSLVDKQPFPLANTVAYNPQKLTSGTYSFVIVSIDNTGAKRFSAPKNFTYTAPVVTLEIAPPSQDDKAQQWVIPLTVTNSQLIGSYRVRIANHDTGIAVVKDQVFPAPPYDVLHIPLSNIPSGKYDVQIDADSPNDALLTTAKVLLTYLAPANAAAINNAPSNGIPGTGGTGSTGGTAGINPLLLIAGAVILFAVAIGGVLVMRQRRPRAIRGLRDLPGLGESAAPGAPTHTKFIPLNEPPLPVAELLIKQSKNPQRQGSVVLVTQRTYTIGRGGCDLNFATQDEGVSAVHVELWCDPKDNSFYVSNQSTTNPVSVNGTLLNKRGGLRASSVPRVKLNSPSSIEFGTVQLIFKAGHIAGKTQPASQSAADGTQVLKRGSDLNAN